MKTTKDLPYAAALCLLVGAVFCAFHGRNGLVDWRTPVHYYADAIAFLAQLKAARDGYVVPVLGTTVPELNAPFEANWNDYPQTQKTLFWLAGGAARLLGLGLTANLLLVSAYLLAGLTFFGVARYLRAERLWAAAGGVAFACAPFIWFRSLEHLSLSFYWHVPLALLVAGWCFRHPGLRVRSRRFVAAVAVAVVCALFNVYYAAMFVQLLGLAVLAQAVRRHWVRTLAPLVLIAVTFGLILLESAGTLLERARQGTNAAAVSRTYAELEIYAMRPLEMVLPPFHGLLHVDRLGGHYWKRPRNEGSAAYLGLLALLGIGVMLAPPIVALLRRRPVWLPPALGAVVWIAAFSIVGGVNAFIGTIGIVLLRGTNRYCIWLVAIALLYLVGRVSRARIGGRRAVVLAIAGLGLALWDQVPAAPSAANIEYNRQLFEDDQHLAVELEAQVPRNGMLFMLPVADYPEVGPIHRMMDYEHFRPYLFTSHIRYSYGGDKGRPREAWQHEIADLTPAEMIDRLERYGFAGIILNRHGYEDQGEEVIQGMIAAGRPVVIDDRRQSRVFVALQPRGEERP